MHADSSPLRSSVLSTVPKLTNEVTLGAVACFGATEKIGDMPVAPRFSRFLIRGLQVRFLPGLPPYFSATDRQVKKVSYCWAGRNR